jgi:hypothetical protein
MWMPTLDRRPQRRPLSQHMPLPNQLVQAPRPHPNRQRRIRSWNHLGAGLVGIEQPVFHYG